MDEKNLMANAWVIEGNLGDRLAPDKLKVFKVRRYGQVVKNALLKHFNAQKIWVCIAEVFPAMWFLCLELSTRVLVDGLWFCL